ncbi:MAG TPA: hypothetical protein VN345_00895, partial [Blastocatellia bacterium]|nr:hypothetical protein [Blastocatellia bacterium]
MDLDASSPDIAICHRPHQQACILAQKFSGCQAKILYFYLQTFVVFRHPSLGLSVPALPDPIGALIVID